MSEPALAPASPHHSLPWTKWEALALDSGYLDGVDNSAAPSHPRIADALTPELSKTFLCRRKARAGNCVRQSSHPALSRIPQHKSLAHLFFINVQIAVLSKLAMKATDNDCVIPL